MAAAPGVGPRPIALLAPDLVERIAAGEVIERPASVVRELVENALDAGATAVRVELREGGLRLVRVADDGAGIPAGELELAVAAHATSKLRDLADLARVRTLGFRGEALASIAAVAALDLCSAAGGSGLAATLAVLPGRPAARGEEARPRGTTVGVRDLFHNVPARRAALRGPRAEAARAIAVVRAYALAHAAVRFTVVADGAVVFQTPGTGPVEAVRAVYGADVARTLHPLAALQLDDARLSGWVAARTYTQPDRAHVVICVNGRPVANHALASALEAGYRPLLRKGRHPIALVGITVDPEQVDPNIHPAKADVLLRPERAIAATLREAVHAALGSAPTQPEAGPPYATGAFAPARQAGLPAARRRRAHHVGEPRTRYGARPDPPDPGPAAGPLPELEPLGQLDAALIVARTPDGHLYLVDQHRAHERLLYEALQRLRPPGAAPDAPAPGPGIGQLLIEPLVVELSAGQATLLRDRVAELAGLGVVCEPFGGSTFLIRALPLLPGAATVAAAFAHDLAADAAEDGDAWFDHVRISLACRSALRRGEALAPSDQAALLRDLRGAVAPAVCPHGSPIILRYSHGFLARVFEW